jgi:hypothetical protein
MEKRIPIFKSFEEQNEWHLDQMRKTTVEERFRQLYIMQQMTKLLHPPKKSEKKLLSKKDLLDKIFLIFLITPEK